MTETVFRPEYSKLKKNLPSDKIQFNKYLESDKVQMFIVVSFVILGILILIYERDILMGIALLFLSVCTLYSFRKGKPVVIFTRDNCFLRIENEKIIANTGYLGLEKKINFINLKELRFKENSVRFISDIGTRNKIKLKIFKMQQRKEIQNKLKEIARSYNIQVFED